MQKQRIFCPKCNQITTQTKEAKKEWVCLCCESAKFRSQAQTEARKKNTQAKPRLNLKF
jgi:hypothetical protein